MTLPTPLFLQCVPQAQFDVVILRDPAKLYYLTGIAQYGDSLDAVLKHLVRDIDFNRYVDVRCLSTSAGGAAALYAGMALGAKRTIAIAGTYPPDEAAKLAGRGRPDLTGMELLPLTVLRQPPTPEPTESVAIFGGKNDLDRKRAQRLQAHIPSLKTVAMGDLEDHMLLQYLAYRQQLPSFFDAYLCPDAPNWGLT